MPRIKESGGWPRLEVYLPSEQMRRRVKLVAAAQDKKLSDYCLEAIFERLEHDEGRQTGTGSLATDLRAWQKQMRTHITAKRMPDSSSVIRHLRKARLHAVAGLR